MGQRQALRTGIRGNAADARRRLRSSCQIPPPSLELDHSTASGNQVLINSGCLIWGVAHQRMSTQRFEAAGSRQAAAREVWSLRRIMPFSLGGQFAAVLLIGQLCVVCEDAVSAVGS